MAREGERAARQAVQSRPAGRAPRGSSTEPVLLATKLHPPGARRELVPRTSLIRMLSAASASKLTLVDAPAGAGKTTLLGEWRATEADRRPFAWVSLDPDDNDPVRFWSYLVEALRGVAPELGAGPHALLRAPGTTLVDVLLPALINELGALSSPVVLVLDDYHVVTNREIHEAVAYLIERLPPTLHVVIATRSDPPFPLARLRASGEMTEIRADGLRFSEAETAVFLNDLLRLGLSPGDVARLQERTEGWVAGLYLAALSLRGRADTHAYIEAFAGDDRHVVDYLATEVLENQAESVRAFLLRTAILDRLSGPLCDEAIDGEDSARMLERIERSNLFLVPLDTRRVWYRYHRLFAELLRHELELREPDLVPALHRRASAWHRANGSIHEAIHHAVRAGDLDDARELIVLHWNSYFNHGRLTTVASWLDALPPEVVSGDPRLCLARAWILMDLGRLDEVAAWIDQATDAAVRRDPAWMETEIAALRLVHRFKIGNIGEASEAALQTLELGESEFERTVTHCLLGITRYWMGEGEGALAELEQAAALARRSENKLAEIYALGYLALIHADRGELEEADGVLQAAMPLGEEPRCAEHFVSMMVHLARGEILQQQGELAAAVASLGRAVELSHRGAGLLEQAASLLALARVRHSLGDRDAARELAREAAEIVLSCPDPGIVAERLAAGERLVRAPPARRVGESAVLDELSHRELAVLRLLNTELSQREIGAALYVSLNTVKTHTKSIFRKLGVSTRAEAVVRAREAGLL